MFKLISPTEISSLIIHLSSAIKPTISYNKKIRRGPYALGDVNGNLKVFFRCQRRLFFKKRHIFRRKGKAHCNFF